MKVARLGADKGDRQDAPVRVVDRPSSYVAIFERFGCWWVILRPYLKGVFFAFSPFLPSLSV